MDDFYPIARGLQRISETGRKGGGKILLPTPQLFFWGSLRRFVFANSSNWPSFIDWAMLRETPWSEDFGRLPLLADSAAPAAIYCFFDWAGIRHRKAGAWARRQPPVGSSATY